MVDQSEYERRHVSQRLSRARSGDDERVEGRRDRDRIIYSEAFHRLADITQVIRHVENRDIVLHNRGLHSQKVAALARTLAERVRDPDVADPDVADAAGLGHDLGHPPFGHIGELALHRLLWNRGVDGFEGNAQTFRVVTKLAWRHAIDPGLDLTRRTLRALLKYPYERDAKKGDASRILRGTYVSEHADFLFATSDGERPVSIEGELANIADDMTFALHDLDDFYRSKVITLRELRDYDSDLLFERTLERHGLRSREDPLEKPAWDAAFARLRRTLGRIDYQPLLERYSSSKLQYGLLRSFTSQMIDRWTRAVSVRAHVDLDAEIRHEILIIKEFVYEEVIEGWGPLKKQQAIDVATLQTLFSWLEERLEQEGKWDRLPRLLQETLSSVLIEDDMPVETEEDFERARTRALADYIARLTESGVREHVAAIAEERGA